MAGRFSRTIKWGGAIAIATSLSGCLETGAGAGNGGSPNASAEPRVVEQEVERPDIFSVEEPGLWDGRPSLGGTWVAHPDVDSPERVRIVNTENGRSIIGALFRRERANAGPALQVSSDAADALGILAGAPTVLSVVVLRTEEVVIEPIIPEETALPPVEVEEAGNAENEVAETEDIEQTTLDPVANAAAALDASEEAAESVAAGAEDVTEEITETPRERRQRLRAERRAQREAERLAQQEARAAEQATEQAEAEQAEATPDTQGAAAADLEKPYIQAAIFNAEDNATDAASALRMESLMTEVVAGGSDESRFWRVIVGPAQDQEQRRALLERVRALGYADAYYVAE